MHANQRTLLDQSLDWHGRHVEVVEKSLPEVRVRANFTTHDTCRRSLGVPPHSTEERHGLYDAGVVLFDRC